MSSAFDMIVREDLMKILTNILNEDEVRMARLLLSNTTLDIKMNGVDVIKFENNKGPPQCGCFSGIFFKICLEDSLRRKEI